MRALRLLVVAIVLTTAGCSLFGDDKGSAIFQLHQLNSKYVKVGKPVAIYVESTEADTLIKAALKQLSSSAYECIKSGLNLAKGGASDEVTEPIIEQCEKNVKEFKSYAVDQLMGDVR